MKQLDALLGFSVRELAGADFNGNIPVPDGVANMLIAKQLARRQLPVSQVRLSALDGDAFHGEVVFKSGLVPELAIHLHIERQPRPDDPVLVLNWSLPSLGPLALLAGSVVSRFKDLPPGIRIEGKQILIDIRTLVSAQGHADLLDYLTALEVHTRQGAFLLHVGVRVPPPIAVP